MPTHFSGFLILSILLLGIACKSSVEAVKISNIAGGNLVEVEFTAVSQDQSERLIEVLRTYPRLKLRLFPGAKYFLGDLTLDQNTELVIEGRGATIQLGEGKQVNSLLTIIDPKSVSVNDLTFSGSFPKGKVSDYLVKIQTANEGTERLVFEGVTFKDGDGGGLRVYDYYDRSRKSKSYGGAQDIQVKNCHFNNVGLYAGVNIRGNQPKVLIDGCTGTDPLSRQHFSRGTMIGVSAEVADPKASLGQVTISNCRVYDANKAFFAQKVKDLKFVNNAVHRLGHRPVYYENGKPVGVVGLKIDDLGVGNHALVEGFSVTETAMLPYRQAISLEQSMGVGVTTGVLIKDTDADAGIRLRGGGNHQVIGGQISKGSITLMSSGNEISQVTFNGREKARDGVVVQAPDSKITDCTFINSQIKLLHPAKRTSIVGCERKGKETGKFVVIDLNKPDNPLSIFLADLTVPEGVEGIWSGGIPDQSKNMQVILGPGTQSLKIHKYVKDKGVLQKTMKKKPW